MVIHNASLCIIQCNNALLNLAVYIIKLHTFFPDKISHDIDEINLLAIHLFGSLPISINLDYSMLLILLRIWLNNYTMLYIFMCIYIYI